MKFWDRIKDWLMPKPELFAVPSYEGSIATWDLIRYVPLNLQEPQVGDVVIHLTIDFNAGKVVNDERLRVVALDPLGEFNVFCVDESGEIGMILYTKFRKHFQEPRTWIKVELQ